MGERASHDGRAAVPVRVLVLCWPWDRPGDIHCVTDGVLVLAGIAPGADGTVTLDRILRVALNTIPPGTPELERRDEWAARAELLRDVWGNLFAPFAFDAAWLFWQERAVPKLARAIYTEGAFHHLPILADALEEAGCNDARILDHLRGPSPHSRGCHVLDAILAGAPERGPV